MPRSLPSVGFALVPEIVVAVRKLILVVPAGARVREACGERRWFQAIAGLRSPGLSGYGRCSVNGVFHRPRCTVCDSGLRMARTRWRSALTCSGDSSS